MNNQLTRALWTVFDLVVAGIVVNYLIHLTSTILDRYFNLQFIPGIEIYFYLYCPIIIAVLQKFNFSSLGVFAREKLIKQSGENVSLGALFIRTTLKPLIVLIWMGFPLMWILFPLLKYSDSKNTPFDDLFNTTTVRISQDISKNNFLKTFFSKIPLFNFSKSYIEVKTYLTKLQLKFSDARKKPGFEKKLLAIYIIWVFMHSILLLISQKLTFKNDNLYIFQEGVDHISVNEYLFFPFDTCRGDYLSGVYDESELFIYTITPIVFYFSARLWKNTTK